MSKKRYVSDSFWTDSWVEDLDPIEKLLYLYMLTNPLVSISGFYEISLRKVAYDTGIDKEMIQKIFNRFEERGKIFYRENIVCIVNFVKNQSIKSVEDNLWKGIKREVEEIGLDKLQILLSDNGLIRGLQGAYKDLPIPYLTLLNLTLPNSTLLDSTEGGGGSKGGNTKRN